LTKTSFAALHLVGGGIQNELLCQLTANAIGRPVSAGPVEASAIGNMLMQLVALGECPDLQSARKLVSASFPIKEYVPEAHEQALWNSAYEKFRRLSGAGTLKPS